MYPCVVLDKQRIFAHRGIWGPGCEGNSLQALDQAIRLGFSIETDIRDHLGSVVVSHDPVPANSDRMSFDSLITLTKNSSSYLALNVKADGLLGILKLSSPMNFFFDMSAPETLNYSRTENSIALRMSDLETELFPKGVKADWLWLDSFEDDWFIEQDLSRFADYKGVVIVSPELHGRPKTEAWNFVASNWRQFPNLCICTDLPTEFFTEMVK
jgi:glycerophosphoryl diester phosphodiesterase